MFVGTSLYPGGESSPLGIERRVLESQYARAGPKPRKSPSLPLRDPLAHLPTPPRGQANKEEFVCALLDWRLRASLQGPIDAMLKARLHRSLSLCDVCVAVRSSSFSHHCQKHVYLAGEMQRGVVCVARGPWCMDKNVSRDEHIMID